MKKHRTWRNLVLILVFAVFLGFTVNPKPLPELETDIPVVTPFWNWMQESTIHLGLDLQGGTQLDYEIDLSDARARNVDDNPDNDVDIPGLLDGVKDVIERRVNSLGVSEPNIYLSSAGQEQHIVVELPGVEDLDEAKEKVGKVVQLEFKTEKESEPSEEDLEAIRVRAQELFEQVSAEESIEDLEAYIEDEVVPNQLEYKSQEDAYLDQLPTEFREIVDEMELNVFYPEVIRAKEATQIFDQGRFYQPEGFNIVRLIEKSTELRKRPVNAEDFAEVMEELGQEPSDAYISEEDVSPEELTFEVISLEPGEMSGVVDSEDGFYILKMEDKLPADTSDEAEPQIHASHILFQTETAEAVPNEEPLNEIPADASEEERSQLEAENAEIEQRNEETRVSIAEITTRNAELEQRNAEIRAQAQEVLAQLEEDPSRFAELAQEYSTDGSAENGGDLGYAAPSNYVEPFQEAALDLEKGEITDELVETQFGYHIIKLNDIKPPDGERYKVSTIRICYEGTSDCEASISKEEAEAQAEEILSRVRQENVYSFERIWLNATPDPWEDTELDGRFFKRADVVYDQISFRPYVSVTFNDEGAELFHQLTQDNVGKPIGIFVGGEFISSPTVQEPISGGQAQITLGTPNVQVALQEANELAQSLNAGSIPAPLKSPNELNIGATLGQDSLQKSIRAGAFGLLLVAIFMILYYRFMGILAGLSLIVYGLFITFVIQSDMSPVIAIALAFAMWIAFAMNLFRSKIDALGKAIFLTFSVVGVVFIFSVLSNPIVLTLAGVAGLILSIGMAVDANILIFERIKEEFQSGKSFVAAVNDGFERAWSSILDSNVSSLITCAILFYFGTSIIKGFAVNLAVGVVISMFTAISVTKTFLLIFEGSKIEKINWLWKKKE